MGITIVRDIRNGYVYGVSSGTFSIQDSKLFPGKLDIVCPDINLGGVDTSFIKVFYFSDELIHNFKNFQDSVLNGDIVIVNEELKKKDGSYYYGN